MGVMEVGVVAQKGSRPTYVWYELMLWSLELRPRGQKRPDPTVVAPPPDAPSINVQDLKRAQN